MANSIITVFCMRCSLPGVENWQVTADAPPHTHTFFSCGECYLWLGSSILVFDLDSIRHPAIAISESHPFTSHHLRQTTT